MRRDANGLEVSPTDLTRFLACEHLTALDVAVAIGERHRPADHSDELLDLLFRKGLEHERHYLERLREQARVTEIDTTDVRTAAAATLAAMRAGAPVIYQAAFLHAGQRGHADFLLSAERPSALGDWSYDVADTKLARRLKVPALLQMSIYGEHLRRIQGTPPRTLTVVAGDGTEHPFPFADVECFARHVMRRFDGFLHARPHTTPVRVEHCAQCRWIRTCYREWRERDDLTFVAFLTRAQREVLNGAGISTLAQLAASEPAQLPRRISRGARERLVAQARLQLSERESETPTYELLGPTPGHGLLRLPEPSTHDLYLDFEADRYVEPDGREYLAGLGDRAGRVEEFWAHSFDEERVLTERLVDRLLGHWRDHPDMHVYHYGVYEHAALQRLTARHGVREAELDILLRAEVFVDLYAVVRQGIRISKESYSIKKLEAFYWGHERGADGTDDVTEAITSVIDYERWLVERDDAILRAIAAYNADDVRSTRDLQIWLEGRRTELEQQCGESFARPEPTEPDRTEPGEAEQREAALAARLLDAGEPLLAGLVGFHRREQRPAWWDLFRLEDLDEEELIDDASAIGALGPPVYVRDVDRSRVWRYEFPAQDTKVREHSDALDVDTHDRVGDVVGIDPVAGWVELKIGRNREPSQPRGIGGRTPVHDDVLREAIAEVAEHSLVGDDCLGARLLRRHLPPGLPGRPGEAAEAAVARIGADLDGGVLAVQGPPGTGKSHTGAELIRALLDSDLRVGVTGPSHQVIGGLLRKVNRPGLQKCDDAQWCGSAQIEATSINSTVVDALTSGEHHLVGGTAWLFAREDMRGLVDVLVIDEAGQYSLANAVAASRAAESLVLLGDPQQLAQPTVAQHPYGAGVSVLAHMLDGLATMPRDRGIFLGTTYRMHPQITDFISVAFYEQRLGAAPGLDRQVLGGSGRWQGAGLRWLPVRHDGNQSASPEESQAVSRVIDELLRCTWTDREGVVRPLTGSDILVVAPYNAHVACLRGALPTDVRVGTVDKFQGAEAPVVIYSTASSSAETSPRGIEFLYDTHRLNVATSRAQAMTILVSSPALLDAEPHTPEQLVLVNALCRYVEMASTVE